MAIFRKQPIVGSNVQTMEFEDNTLKSRKVRRMVHPVDLDQLAQELDSLADGTPEPENIINYAPRELPTYVADDPESTEIGKLAGEAIVKEYESAAQALDNMGKELKEMINSLITQVADLCNSATAAVADIEETTKVYRHEAKLVFEHIQSAAKIAEHVRNTAVEMRNKITDNKGSRQDGT